MYVLSRAPRQSTCVSRAVSLSCLLQQAPPMAQDLGSLRLDVGAVRAGGLAGAQRPAAKATDLKRQAATAVGHQCVQP
jgi:hypothetical protein